MWNRTENQVKIVFIRHGATTSNEQHRYLGKMDESLSDAGRKTLRNKKEAGLYPAVDFLFGSPMKRCRETAEILYPGQQFRAIPDWEEMDFGVFEGRNYMDLKGDARYQEWIDSNGTLPFPEGETREEFLRRCRNGFDRVLACVSTSDLLCQKKEPVVGLIVHGGTIMALLSSYGGGDYFDYRVNNGGGYHCLLAEEHEGKIRLEQIIGLAEA